MPQPLARKRRSPTAPVLLLGLDFLFLLALLAMCSITAELLTQIVSERGAPWSAYIAVGAILLYSCPVMLLFTVVHNSLAAAYGLRVGQLGQAAPAAPVGSPCCPAANGSPLSVARRGFPPTQPSQR